MSDVGNSSGIDRDRRGALLADVTFFFDLEFKSCLQILLPDYGRLSYFQNYFGMITFSLSAEYLWAVMSDLAGSLKNEHKKKTVTHLEHLIEVNNSNGDANNISETGDALDSLKCIFPDYGEGFLVACLKVIFVI